MAGHAQLKFVMTECSKTQIHLTGLIYYSTGSVRWVQMLIYSLILVIHLNLCFFFLFHFQTGMFTVGGRHYFIEPLKRDFYSKEHFNESDSAIPHQLYPLKYSHSNIHNSTDSHCGTSYNGEYTFYT